MMFRHYVRDHGNGAYECLGCGKWFTWWKVTTPKGHWASPEHAKPYPQRRKKRKAPNGNPA